MKKKEETLLKALELAHATIETLQSNVDDLSSQLNDAKHSYYDLVLEKNRLDTINDINKLAEMKRML